VLQRVVAAEKDPARTSVAEVMSTPVACAAMQTTSDEIKRTFREKRIRHLPVVEDGRVVGMVSIGDINRAENNAHEQTIKYLEQYVSVL